MKNFFNYCMKILLFGYCIATQGMENTPITFECNDGRINIPMKVVKKIPLFKNSTGTIYLKDFPIAVITMISEIIGKIDEKFFDYQPLEEQEKVKVEVSSPQF